MAISADSPTFKLEFTDGTFMTMFNSHWIYTSGGGEFTFIFPNLLLSNAEPWYGSVIKYDSKGNKYEFFSDGVIINEHSYRASGENANRIVHFVYNPDNDSLGIWWSLPRTNELPYFPYSDRAVTGMVYKGNCGSAYSSLGAAIAKGQDYLNRLSYGYYEINNILPRNPNQPFNGLNVFKGTHGETVINSKVSPGGSGTTINSSHYTPIREILENFDPVSPLPKSNDPFEPGGVSGGGGGGGTFDLTSDSIDIPNLPSMSASDAGFITLFNPSLSELRNLASYMWSGLFDVDTFRKIFADPMDCILGLSIVPVNVPAGSQQPVKVGNISTGVQMTTASSQYVEVDCGSITIEEYWGAYLDYEPFTKCEIYLPYIGTHAICTDDIMGKTVSIKYHVDILSGACTAYIKAGDSVLYEFIGQCSSSIPITGNDWTNVINGVITIAASIGSMVATGGAAAPSTAGAAARAATHKQLNAIHESATIASTAVNSLKPTVEKSGAMSGTGGMLAIQKPYVIITRPRQALPESQNYFTGYPSFTTEILRNLTGFTVVECMHLTGIPGTNEEVVEIENLLMLGVIL